MRDDSLGDGGDLAWGLARAEDDFGEPLPKRAEMVHAGESEVFERQPPQVVGDERFRVGGGERPGLNLVQQGANRWELGHVILVWETPPRVVGQRIG